MPDARPAGPKGRPPPHFRAAKKELEKQRQFSRAAPKKFL
jgi:hypothetical protein